MTDIETAAYIASTEYCAELKKIIPNARVPENGVYHGKDATPFLKIAKWCAKAEVNVRDFIRAAFPIVRANSSSLLPRDFVKPYVFKQYLGDTDAASVGKPQAHWAQQGDLLRQARWLHDADVTDVELLRSLAIPFLIWFRVFCPEVYDEELMTKHGRSAWDELKGDRRLRDFLRMHRTATLYELESRIASFGDGFK